MIARMMAITATLTAMIMIRIMIVASIKMAEFFGCVQPAVVCCWLVPPTKVLQEGHEQPDRVDMQVRQ